VESYLLLNGETLTIHENVPVEMNNLEISMVDKLIQAQFFLIAEISGKMVGYLVVKRGQKVRNTYTGELDINIHRDYLKVGIEKVLFESMTRWFNKMDAIRKVQLKIKINSLMNLELLIDLCTIQQEIDEDKYELFSL